MFAIAKYTSETLIIVGQFVYKLSFKTVFTVVYRLISYIF